MKKLIVLTIVLSMIVVSNKIQAACSTPTSNTAACTMASYEGYAHDRFYATANSDITFNWQLTNGNSNIATWVWVETPLAYYYDAVTVAYDNRYYGTLLTTDYTGFFEMWLNSNNGGSASVYAQW